MGFNYENGHEAVRFTVQSVSGLPAVAGYLLRFSVGYVVHAWNRTWGDVPPTFHSVVARVEVGHPRLRLGTAVPEGSFVLTPYDHVQNAAIAFELIVSNAHVEHLERIRSGAAIEFLLGFSGVRTGSRVTAEFVDARYKAEQATWIRVLEDAGYGHFLIFDLPIHLGKDEKLREAWKVLSNAGKQIHTGHYNGAVADCRRALEAALQTHKFTPELARATQKRQLDPKRMTKTERFWHIVDAVRHATQLSVHVDAENQVIEYSRDEALLIFGSACAAVRDVAAHIERATEAGVD